MDWSNDTILKFVQAYGEYPCLWDPTHPHRNNRFRRTEAWHAIKKELGDVCTLDDLRKKKESLMTSYRFYKSKVMKSEPNDRFEPSWFAYSAMDAFLGWIYETSPTASMQNVHENSEYRTVSSDYYQDEWADSSDQSAASDVKNDIKNNQDKTEDKQNPTAQSKMNWSYDNTIKFLKLYRRNSCLWDPSHPENALVQCRTKAWNAISKEMGGQCAIEELKKKKEILIGTYRRFKRSDLKSTSKPPDWFAYSLIDSFLAPIYKYPRASLRTENKNRSTCSSSDEQDNLKKKPNFVSEITIKTEYPEEMETQLDIEFVEYEDNEQIDTEYEQRTVVHSAETQIDGWPNENVIKFLELYQKHPCLWDPLNCNRKNKIHRNKAWLAIKKGLDDLYTVEELKKKKEILMFAYRRCQKMITEKRTTDIDYRPTWFAYEVMDGFLSSMVTTARCPDSPEASVSTMNRECTSDQSSEEDDMNISKMDAQDETEDLDRVINRRRSESHVDWTKENVFKFIRLFQSFPCLWNPTDPEYANRRDRMKAWLTIKKELGDRFTVNELRRRKDILLFTYKRCKKNAEELEAKNCVYEPTWFAYTIMDSFLDSVDKCSVFFTKTDENEDEDDSAKCYNNANVKRNQKLYKSLPSRCENPLEPAIEMANADLNSSNDDDARNESEDEQELTTDPEYQMDWSHENVFRFLEMFKRFPCLWDPTHPERTFRQCVTDAWNSIKRGLGDRCTVGELKKKKDSLLAQYRRCKKKSMETDAEQTWFAYSVIDSFLGSVYKCQDVQKPQAVTIKTEKKQRGTSKSSFYQEDSNSLAYSEPDEIKKEENYVLIVSAPEHGENPLELPIELENRVNRSVGEEQNNSEDERIAASDPTQTCWSLDDVLKFIELYRGQTVLWNPDNPYRRSKHSLANAWNAIKKDLDNRWTVDELKRKKESLLSMYRSIKTKIVKSDSAFQPSWFAFSALEDFLGSVYKSSATPKSKSKDRQNREESSESEDDGEPEIKRENFVSVVPTSTLKRKIPLELPVEVVPDTKKPKSVEEIEEDDECSLFGKLVTSKLRKASQDRRDWLMLKINELFYRSSVVNENAEKSNT